MFHKNQISIISITSDQNPIFSLRSNKDFFVICLSKPSFRHKHNIIISCVFQKTNRKCIDILIDQEFHAARA